MKTANKALKIISIAAIATTLITVIGVAHAADKTSSAALKTQAKLDAKANVFIDKFIRKMVKKHKFNEDYLYNLFDQVNVNTTVTEKMNRPFEAKPWHVYRKFFLTDKRIQGGVKYWHQHEQTLKRAENKYGVPASIIIAILGVETNYGETQGSFPVLETLTTLAFNYPSRARFFTKELEQYLLMTREQKLDPLKMNGSYAGAIGMPQFMPSSYRSYAVDFSGHHSIDLSNNHEDAIGSIANYLHRHGWERNGKVATPAKVSGTRYKKLDVTLNKPKLTVKDLTRFGVIPKEPARKHARSLFVELDNRSQSPNEYWVGFNNYFVISRYNHNHQYVMAVYQLAQEIEKIRNTQLAQRHKQNKKKQS